jgi:hypothetical protein
MYVSLRQSCSRETLQKAVPLFLSHVMLLCQCIFMLISRFLEVYNTDRSAMLAFDRLFPPILKQIEKILNKMKKISAMRRQLLHNWKCRS